MGKEQEREVELMVRPVVFEETPPFEKKHK